MRRLFDPSAQPGYGSAMAQRRKAGKAAQGSQVAIRVEADLLARATALAERMAQAPDLRAFRVSRASVLRLAMLRGLDALDVDYPDPSRRRRP